MSVNVDVKAAKKTVRCLSMSLIILSRYGILDKEASLKAAKEDMGELEDLLSEKVAEIEREENNQ